MLRGGQIANESLIARHVGDLTAVTCASPDYLTKHGIPNHPLELMEKHALVRYFFAGSGRRAPIVFQKEGELIHAKGSDAIGVNDSNAYLAAGVAGIGVLHTLLFIAKPHIDAGRLVPILTDWSSPANPISVVYSPNRHLSARVRAFVEWMSELFRDRQGDI